MRFLILPSVQTTQAKQSGEGMKAVKALWEVPQESYEDTTTKLLSYEL
jgi:hypothetical protein